MRNLRQRGSRFRGHVLNSEAGRFLAGGARLLGACVARALVDTWAAYGPRRWHAKHRVDSVAPTVVILLTATVDAGDTPFVIVRDPDERLGEYVANLARWLDAAHRVGVGVVICENSGVGWDELERVAADSPARCEVLRIPSNREAHERGKGAGEADMLRVALSESRIVREADYILKVTGRCYIAGWETLFARCCEEPAVDVYADMSQSFSMAKTRCYLARPSLLRDYLLPITDLINDHEGRYLEHVFASAVLTAMGVGRTWSPMPMVPAVVGVSGTTGESLTPSAMHYFMASVRRHVFVSMVRAKAQ